MLDEIFAGILVETMTFASTLYILCSALGLGFIVSSVYRWTHQKEGFSSSFSVTLIMLPAIIAMIILLVGNNVARAFSLAGAFSLIRFRSAPGDSIDIAYVFFTLGVGLACGMGFLGFAVLFAVILCLVMLILEKVQYGHNLGAPLRLKIMVSEDTDYQGVFEEILDAFTTHYHLRRIKTTEYGALFEITYDIKLKHEADSKAFIDQLRAQNGNLQISLTINEDERAVL